MRDHRTVAQPANGQSMVEFALILPFLVAFLFGIIELGILINIYTSLTNTAREAARAASIYQESAPLMTTTDLTGADARRLQYMSQVITSTINPMINPATDLQVTLSYTPTAAVSTNLYRSGDTISVQLTHNHQLFFGVLGRSAITLTASSAMRIEPGGTR
jgi:Flp pilus assembly protein TadG